MAKGFSIVELMVSVGIIALLIGISFPFISAMTTGSRVEAGLNVAGMSVDVARQWVEAEAWANDGSTAAPTRESYSGTAALFCPTNEVRIVSNDRNAQSASSVYLEDNNLNGFKDLSQVDYIRIPERVGIAGIQRTGSGANDIRFIAPPFAIAFNEFGQLNYGDSGVIYYNSDGSTYYETTARTATYNPSAWTDVRTDAADFRSDQSFTLPFETIECVPGVVVFSQEDFFADGFSFDGGGEIEPSDTAAWAWLKENGRTIFFSPHTGVALRDEEE